MSHIIFGTDGWRAVIGETFTPENIAKVAQAFCDLYPNFAKPKQAVAIGYDRRRMSPEAARLVAEVLVANDIPVHLSETFCPTPAVAWYTKHRGLAAGVMITASHNPPQWNGIKFKESYGGAASAEFVKPLEARIALNDAEGKQPRRADLHNNPLLTSFNAHENYINALEKLVNIELIRAQKYRVLVDPLYGAGCGYFPLLLGDQVTEIHTAADPNFGGLHPEPIPPYVNELIDRMRHGTFNYGAILDGDADRASCVDENGKFVTTHEFYCLLIKHAVENKKWSGKIIKSISTTRMVDRLGKKYGLAVETVPVGFKYISPAMLDPTVLCGGEESGGFGFPLHIPERDGLLSNLMLLELMSLTKKTLSTLVADIQREFGPTFYRRNDYSLSSDRISAVRAKFEKLHFTECAGQKLMEHSTIDGHHFRFADDSWLLFRASGTEPLIRVYAEAPTLEQVDRMLIAGREQLGLEHAK